jgi:hypothetical protein
MEEELRRDDAIVEQFLAVSRRYLTSQPVGTATESNQVRSGTHALAPPAQLDFLLSRRASSKHMTWTFAGRHRHP